MRKARVGIAWSPKRAQIRREYGGYMASRAWYARRRRWLIEHRQAAGSDPVCGVCGAPWRLSHDDLHHRSYRRLGHEDRRDLVPMCRACHDRLHVLLDGNSEWRHFHHEQATDFLITYLRKEQSQ